eukprot:CAMPEP_0113946530 /NCGR_PEP_ID=MMETSP1339-20121228/58349_1 /TAXON_ID=94617 /ORGANISM="Fibrocapsa japonica" /LENGTH=160 /DNA_ID=CAMNT_0000952667 /DNA_START=104 /DNA_END=586 /DNA_ORIENTATION=+ /assembly_acc=CAM_ASM_000762
MVIQATIVIAGVEACLQYVHVFISLPINFCASVNPMEAERSPTRLRLSSPRFPTFFCTAVPRIQVTVRPIVPQLLPQGLGQGVVFLGPQRLHVVPADVHLVPAPVLSPPGPAQTVPHPLQPPPQCPWDALGPVRPLGASAAQVINQAGVPLGQLHQEIVV